MSATPQADAIAAVRAAFDAASKQRTGRPYPWTLRDDVHALALAEACGGDQTLVLELLRAAWLDPWLRNHWAPATVARSAGQLLARVMPDPLQPVKPAIPAGAPRWQAWGYRSVEAAVDDQLASWAADVDGPRAQRIRPVLRATLECPYEGDFDTTGLLLAARGPLP